VSYLGAEEDGTALADYAHLIRSPEELKEVIQERIESATASACLLAFSQCCVDVESL
jgi:hypothetical protein